MKNCQNLLNLFILFALQVPAWAQGDTLLRSEDQKAIAVEQAEQLQQGALVVRLKTKSRNISAYREAGLDEVADRIKEEQRIENNYIVRSFIEYFDFAPVYFIFTSYTDSLLGGVRKGIFLDQNLEIVDSILMDESFFLFAERGPVDRKVYVDDRDLSKGFTYDSNPTITDALVIRDSDLNQLFSPFPYYVTAPMKDDKFFVAVKKLDNRLNKLLENK
jgi:hypothetical protein